MSQQLNSLKEEITQIRAGRGKSAKIPRSIWIKINELSKKIPLATICQSIGIQLNNARKRIKDLDGAQDNISSSNEKVNLFQVPIANSPILEISMPSGTTIKVYSV